MSLTTHGKAFAAPRTDASGRIPLIGLTATQMREALAVHDIPAFRAKQVWHWVYQRGVQTFDAMANISKDVRAVLVEHYSIDRPKVVTEQKSEDGTIKWLLQMSDGQQVETVFIPEDTRGTLCISSQVGCTLTCKFCHTGTQPLVRNLGIHEILQQIMHARDVLQEWPSSALKKTDAEEGAGLTNIVLMGMGEPLYNYENVAAAMKICTDPEGLAIGKRRITLSTSGVVPLMHRCGEELGINLAISLHAATDELRSSIMPINNKYPLNELMEACRTYPGLSAVRRITFEYVMLKGVNDSDDDARKLVTLLRDIPHKVNLIPFNPWPGSGFECSSNTRIDKFSKILIAAGVTATVRKTRGRDILAACGQLKSESLRPKKTHHVDNG